MEVEANNISFTYDGAQTPALKNVSFEVKKGEFIGITGRAGSGKTTLAELLAGLMKPDKGSIFIDGKDINSPKYDKTQLRKRLGVIFQYPEHQLFETTLERDVAFSLKQFKISDIDSRVKKAFEETGLNYEKMKDRSPMSLSGGEKRRAVIAGVIVLQPEVLILDEPLSGLDGKGRESFLRLMKNLNARGVTLITVTHSADFLAEYADRVLVLDSGEKVFDGTPRSLFSASAPVSFFGLRKPDVKITAEILYSRGKIKTSDIITEDEFVEAVKSSIVGGERL